MGKREDELEPDPVTEEPSDEALDALDQEGDIIVLVDANGQEAEFRMFHVVRIDEQAFALLTPVHEQNAEADTLEIALMRYLEDENGDPQFADIDDDVLFAKVQSEAEVFMKGLLAEDDEEEAATD